MSNSTHPKICFKDLREAFRIFDKDRSGYIEAKELISVTTTMGQALSKEELTAFMQEADLDGDGKLDYEEFVTMLTKPQPEVDE